MARLLAQRGGEAALDDRRVLPPERLHGALGQEEVPGEHRPQAVVGLPAVRADLWFGRIVVSEREAPGIFVLESSG